MSNSTILTPEGHKKIIDELQLLKTVRRKEISDRIEYAKSLGDLSENAEYQTAREDQAFSEGRILELEELLKNATVVAHQRGSDVVNLGDHVQLETGGKQLQFQVVGANESNPAERMISNESPLGRALLGARVGSSVTVQTPRGIVTYTVLKINQ
ncbi:transcription elongation factor GreA [Candidatus Uhrbacteria bacterium]|nr:transcription elongation factor GreA [Candidatus Uhrbacteria bacterium]